MIEGTTGIWGVESGDVNWEFGSVGGVIEGYDQSLGGGLAVKRKEGADRALEGNGGGCEGCEQETRVRKRSEMRNNSWEFGEIRTCGSDGIWCNGKLGDGRWKARSGGVRRMEKLGRSGRCELHRLLYTYNPLSVQDLGMT